MQQMRVQMDEEPRACKVPVLRRAHGEHSRGEHDRRLSDDSFEAWPRARACLAFLPTMPTTSKRSAGRRGLRLKAARRRPCADARTPIASRSGKNTCVFFRISIMCMRTRPGRPPVVLRRVESSRRVRWSGAGSRVGWWGMQEIRCSGERQGAACAGRRKERGCRA